MSLSILVSYSDSPNMILGGSHAMVPLVAEVAEYMKECHPSIYTAAFEELEWGGNVDLSGLGESDFVTVYDASRASYEKFLALMDDIEQKEPGVFKMWQKYLAAMEADPRLVDRK